MTDLVFPKDFLWGAATSAYQIEGSPLADGAGPSIWHQFSHQPGKIAENHHGDVACEHYHRFNEDVTLMSELELKAYRFSIAWSRIFPDGTGKHNPAGMAFYERLVDALLDQGIVPVATLYHWDLPSALEKRGGWQNPEIANWFAEYAHYVAQVLGDRIHMWATINEPWVVMDQGFRCGTHAPGIRDLSAVPKVAVNLLRAHGAATEALRSIVDKPIGIVVNLTPQHAASMACTDMEARSRAHSYINEHFLDPILRSQLPEPLVTMHGQHWPEISDADWRWITQPIDFVGVNYYSRNVVRHCPDEPPACAALVPQKGNPHTSMEWEVYPQGLVETLEWVGSRYGGIPLYITENGAAFPDADHVNGSVQDVDRKAYFQSHISALHDALLRGANVRGYFAWSLLDNFEWSLGYTKRFGIIHVDYQTQKRTPKDSAHWYADFIRNAGG